MPNSDSPDRTARLGPSADEPGSVRDPDSLLSTGRQNHSSLEERERELKCLYAVEGALHGFGSRSQTSLQGVAQALPEAFRYPDCVAARIRLGDRELATAGYRDAVRRLSCPVVVDDQELGEVEVAFVADPPDHDASFPPEKRELFSLIADRVGAAWRNQHQQGQLELLATALHSAANAVIITDPDGRILWVNAAFTESSGYTSREALGRVPRELLDSGEHDEAFYEHLWQTILSGAVWRGELVNRRKDGSIYREEQTVTPVLDRDDRISHFIAVKVDITEKLRAGEEQRRLLSIIDATPDLVGMCDRDGRILYINRGGRRLLGVDPAKDLRGTALSSLQPEWAVVRIREEAVPKAAEAGSWHGETAILGAGGEEIPVWQIVIAHRSQNGEVEFLSTTARDLREPRKLEQQFLQAQKMEAVGRLAGGVAHDFNNLLTVIRGQSELILEAMDPASSLSDELRQVLKEVERAGRLSRQLLAFSRKQVMVAKAFDLSSTLSSMEPMLRHLLPERIALRFEAAEDPVPIRADPGQLHQMLLNLAVNAGDAISGAGTVTFGAAIRELTVPETTRLPWSVDPGSYAQLTVEDTGSGMKPQVLERIFEPFFTTKAEGKGTGLGLSMVIGIMKQSGGHVLVESEDGRGTTFHLLFPLHDAIDEEGEKEAPVGPAPVTSAAKRPGKTVLLVEDTLSVRNVAIRVLEREGYTVLAAADGGEALEIGRQHRDDIDLIVSDIVMPGMSGSEFMEGILEIFPDRPIVLMSGYSEDELTGGVLHQATLFLEKPFSTDELARVVREALEQPG